MATLTVREGGGSYAATPPAGAPSVAAPTVREGRERYAAAPLAGAPPVVALRVREGRERYAATPLPAESEIAALWEEQRLPPEALVLADGSPIRVVYRGRRNRGPGPDFLKAAIVFPGEELRYGDVEIHVREGDWCAHGHHRDPAYEGVVLHVVYDPAPHAAQPAVLPVLALGAWVRRRAGSLTALMGGELLAPEPWREPCHDARRRLGDDALGATLRRLALRRLHERAAMVASDEALAAEPFSPAARRQLLHRLLFEALGYPRNDAAFARLAAVAPWEELAAAMGPAPPGQRAQVAEAILFARSGLLAAEDAVPGAARLSLWRRAAELGERPRMAASAWRRWGVRPGNRPERRIAAAAVFAARFAEQGPVVALTDAARDSTGALLAALTAGPTPAWGRASLAGRGRAIELATNAVAPLLLAMGNLCNDAELRSLAIRRYLELPNPGPYGRTAMLEGALAADGPAPASSAAGQQALLYLQEHYCSRGRCGRCPVSWAE